MPRTVNPAAYTVKREAFVDAAQRLIQAKGYEEMSVQDVLDELEASRGAFYHYFESKENLLEAVLARLVDGASALVNPILADQTLSAPRKLEMIFGGIAELKGERKDLVLRIMEVWTSDANAIVREKLRRTSTSFLIPVLAQVVAQGTRDGDFAARDPEETAAVLLSLMLGFQEKAVEMFLARQAGTVTFDSVQQSVDAWTRAYERVLGAKEGSLTLSDERTLHFWFG
ncbi:MAG TPA: TetR/AcrR family transcriptional regulator [Candidatus Udaeobacter sp.]|nr:TetR/AcrR family transcriptional regulator [Candidatus Udaeobacter sp.]